MTRLLLACTMSVSCVALASGCVIDFATIVLRVHQSADPTLRRDADDNSMQVKYVLDEILPDDAGLGARVVNGFTFGNDDVLDSPKQPLKPNPQRMTMALAVGAGTGFPLASALAIGRVDPLIVPSVDGGAVQLNASAFLAAPDAFEVLDGDTPSDGPQAVCDNGAGFVHAVGENAAYAFNDDLVLNDNELSFNANAGDLIACDVADVFDAGGTRKLEDGPLVVAYGPCTGDPEATHTVVFNVGGDEVKLDAEPGELCDPFVQVVNVAGGSVVWVAGQTFAALYDLEEAKPLDREDFDPLFLTGPVRHVLLKNGALIASGTVTDPGTGDTVVGSPGTELEFAL